jgi:hypothetical protein
MLVGFPMNPANMIYKWFPGQHTLAHLHLELRLVQLLRQNGYRIIYKVHPDQCAAVAGIFDGLVDRIEHGRFEEAFACADCLLFGHSNTTTFGYALLTNRPMVLINVRGKPWYPPFLDLVGRRCKLVDAQADAGGRIDFDDRELLSAISEAPATLSHEVVEQFAL